MVHYICFSVMIRLQYGGVWMCWIYLLQQEFDYLIINKVEVFTLDGGNCSLLTESPQLI